MKIIKETLVRLTFNTTYDKEFEVIIYCKDNNYCIVDKKITSWLGDKEQPIGYTIIAEQIIADEIIML